MDIENWEPPAKKLKPNGFPEISPVHFYPPNFNFMGSLNMGNKDDRGRKRERVFNIFEIYGKQISAIHRIEDIKDKNVWLKHEPSGYQPRIYCMEWKNELLGTMKNICQNFKDLGRVVQSRYFIVASFNNFFRNYSSLPDEHKHFYEIVQEGYPCHLYFDIERKQFEDKNDEVAMIHLLMLMVRDEVRRYFQIHLDDEELPFVDLKSSDEHKVSHHIIVKLENGKTVFKNNQEMQNFVKNLVSSLRIYEGTRKEDIEEYLFYETEIAGRRGREPKIVKKCVIDESVYSKNRHFRLIWSRKNRSNRVFILESDSTVNLQHTNRVRDDKEIFLNSLATNVDIRDEDIKYLVFEEERMYSKIKEEELEKLKARMDDPSIEDINPNHLIRVPPIPSLKISYQGSMKGGVETSTEEFPEVTRYILGIWNSKNNVNKGYIRSMTYFSTTKILVCCLANNRYCERIGRMHKSNNVILVANMREKIFYQKCNDEDCRNFRSPTYTIPNDNIDKIPEKFGL